MPFRRRRSRRPRRKPTALKAVRRLARFVDTELHQAINVNQNIDIGGNGVFFQLVLVPQGDDDTDRNGIQITMRKLEIRLIVSRGNADCCFRTIILLDRQSNGAIPTNDDVLQITATDPQQVVSPLNNDNKKRFRVLSDRTRTLVDGNSNERCFAVHHKLSTKVRFDGAGTGIADVVSGMLWLFMFTDQAAGAAAPDVTMISRVWFAP